MQNLFSGSGPPLPETLLADLEELLTWDNNCLLTWVSLGNDCDRQNSRWFTVLLTSDGQQFGLRLEFWVPEWMTARGVDAVLPAHLSVQACTPGKEATVDLGMRRWSELEASLPKVARTSARLMNELWGPTVTDEVLLLTIEYQEEQLETPFPQLPTYGR